MRVCRFGISQGGAGWCEESRMSQFQWVNGQRLAAGGCRAAARSPRPRGGAPARSTKPHHGESLDCRFTLDLQTLANITLQRNQIKRYLSDLNHTTHCRYLVPTQLTFPIIMFPFHPLSSELFILPKNNAAMLEVLTKSTRVCCAN